MRSLWIGVILWHFSNSFLFSQYQTSDYPSWFLEPPDRPFIVGLSKNYSVRSESIKEAWVDAISMDDFYHGGIIRTNLIAHKRRLADSLKLTLGEKIELSDSVTLIQIESVGTLFIGLFKVNRDNSNSDDLKRYGKSNTKTLTTIGKQTIHPDRIFESWASAEIEAIKELSRIKRSKIQSINKKSGSNIEKLIYLQSESQIRNAKVDRRWVKNNVAYVQVSDAY